MNDNYIIKEDYHGDIKLIKIDKPKKVNLSKPTDTLDHRVKQNLEPLKVATSNKKICLTKPEDLAKINKHTIYQPNANLPLKYTIDKSEQKSKSIFSEFKVWFVAFALIVIFINLSINLGVFANGDILNHITFNILLMIAIVVLLFIIISPAIFIISLILLVRSIKNSNTSNTVRSVILLILSFLGLCVWGVILI